MQGKGRHDKTQLFCQKTTCECPLFHRVGTGDWTPVTRLGGKHLYLPSDPFYSPIKFLLHLLIYLCVYVWACAGVTVPIWWPEGNLWESVMSFHHMGTELRWSDSAAKYLHSSQWPCVLFLKDVQNNFSKVCAPFYILPAHSMWLPHALSCLAATNRRMNFGTEPPLDLSSWWLPPKSQGLRQGVRSIWKSFRDAASSQMASRHWGWFIGWRTWAGPEETRNRVLEIIPLSLNIISLINYSPNSIETRFLMNTYLSWCQGPQEVVPSRMPRKETETRGPEPWGLS